MKYLLICLCGALLLSGCDSQKYVAPLEGRIAVSVVESKPLAKAKGQPKYRETEKVTEWVSSNANQVNNRPNGAVGSDLKLVHTISVGEGVDDGLSLPTPVVKKGIIYTLDGQFVLQATDMVKGEPLWKRQLAEITGTSFKSIGLAVAGDRLYAVAGNGVVVATDLKGKEVWQINLKTQLRSEPVVDRGFVFISDINNQLIALDSETGKEIWAYQGEKAETNLFGIGSVAVRGSFVIAPTTSGRVNAFDRTTGVLLWTEDMWQKKTYNPLLDMPQVTASPVIDNQVAYLIGNAGKMGAYQVADGRALFVLNMGGRRTPIVNGNTLLFINNQNEMMAVNKENGSQYWKTALAIPSDHVEIGALSAAFRSKSNIEKEQSKAKNRVWYSPILAGSQIVLVAADGTGIVLDSKTGVAKYYFDSDEIVASPIAVDQSVILLTKDGELHIYR